MYGGRNRLYRGAEGLKSSLNSDGIAGAHRGHLCLLAMIGMLGGLWGRGGPRSEDSKGVHIPPAAFGTRRPHPRALEMPSNQDESEHVINVMSKRFKGTCKEREKVVKVRVDNNRQCNQ